jgi:hypothetical protein
MCRYGFKNYKLTYACFRCQIGFKRPNLFDVQPELARQLLKNASIVPLNVKEAKCPNCSNEMANLGRDLRLPIKTKNEQWQCIKYLYEMKYNIYSCGCSGIGYVPHKMEEAIQLVKEYKNEIPNFKKKQALQEKKEILAQKRKKNSEELKTKQLLRAIKKDKPL